MSGKTEPKVKKEKAPAADKAVKGVAKQASKSGYTPRMQALYDKEIRSAMQKQFN